MSASKRRSGGIEMGRTKVHAVPNGSPIGKPVARCKQSGARIVTADVNLVTCKRCLNQLMGR